MSSSSCEIGVIGLSVMGANLALNIESRGYEVAVYNRTASVTEEFLAKDAAGKRFAGGKTMAEFAAALKRPRRAILLVKAGKPVDDTIAALLPHFEPGDIIIDGGNSLFSDTERRSKELEAKGFHFVGMGVSGGEEGARFGPALMPGGSAESYAALSPILEAIAAKTDSGACVTHVGRGSAGHFVKMVHNGIEYGDMQLIAETYDILREIGGLTPDEMKDTFGEWNRGRLLSFLIEITENIVSRKDPATGRLLLDVIVDRAGQKGTGKWTTVAALDLGVPIPTITAAVDARIISSMKDERIVAEKNLSGAKPKRVDAAAKKALITQLEAALYTAKISAYAQGMAMLRKASQEFNYGLRLDECARIWKGGCIIRAKLLDRITSAFKRDPQLTNLLLDAEFSRAAAEGEGALRGIVALAAQNGIAAPAFGASLSYYDAYRRARGPAYVTQAQRDYFGAHTFERDDQPGMHHFDWTGLRSGG